MSSHYYVACDLGMEDGRVTLGTLDKGKLTVSEVRRFSTLPVKEKDSVLWDVPQVYREILAGLREISAYEEPLDGISCSAWTADYLLFEQDGSLITPTQHQSDPRAERARTSSKIPWEAVYEETGMQTVGGNMASQLAAEKQRRLVRASHLMPIADGFNYLLSGIPRAELSLASLTQLFNPTTQTWSERLLKENGLPSEIFPPLVTSGTKLGPLRADVARETGIEESNVIASCSHELAAALMGLPVDQDEIWAYLKLGNDATLGTELVRPIITDQSRDVGFNNQLVHGGAVNFHKHTVGFWILEECKRFWKTKDRDLDDDILKHLATSSAPFESLIDPDDPQFRTPGDMPLKIQAYCKQTHQPVPRKPGPVIRCVLESLALHYRRTFMELESLTGREFARVYLLGGSTNSLLNHFTANALQVPVVTVSGDSVAIGNTVVQALALGHIKSLQQAREIVRHAVKTETITPHAAVWNAAYDRLSELAPP